MSTEKSLEVFISNRKSKPFTHEEQQVRFAYYFASILSSYYKDGKIDYQGSKYRRLVQLRRKLNIPGRSFDLIDLEYRSQFPQIPQWCFRKHSRQDKLEKWKQKLESFQVVTNVY